VTSVTSLIGQGALRFLLTYTPEKKNSAYALFLVDVDDYRKIEGLAEEVENHLAENFPDAQSYVMKFQLGPGAAGKVQVRLLGPDPDVVRQLAAKVEGILYDDGEAKAIRTSWRQRVKVVRPQLAEEEANLAGISRQDVATVLKAGFEGVRVGVYRERDLLIPILVRAPDEDRGDIGTMMNLQIWSPAAGRAIPLRQVVSGTETTFEDEIIIRIDRTPTLTVLCDPKSGPASVLFNRVRPAIEAIEMPPGCRMEWGGEYEDSAEAQEGLMASIPFFVLAMILIVIVLFNALRQPAIIWLCVPLALIGVTVGLLLTGQPFGFMALLGFLSLSGMLIKNAIVLIDQIDLEIREGKEHFRAIVDSGVSRVRPVAMAAATTALGMIPLLSDAFFIAMAVTIIFGLVFATVLTMVVVPVLYGIFFRVPYPRQPAEG
jgi:multidrug efflux pump subunit AcrB